MINYCTLRSEMFDICIMLICLSFVDVFNVGIWAGLREVADPDLRRLADQLPSIAIRCRQEGTVRNYTAAYLRWKQWAANYEEVQCLPTEPRYVAIYLLNLSQTSKTHAPVTNAYYGISWAHRTAGLPDPTQSELPKMIREAWSRVLGQGDNKKLPVSSQVVAKIVNSYAQRFECISDLRLAAMCVVAFAGFLRFDELSRIRFCDVIFRPTHMEIFIEKSKTDQHRKGNRVFIARLKSVNCPVRIFRRYLIRAGFGADYSEMFVFRGITRHKNIASRTLKKSNIPLSYNTARVLLLKAFESVGCDQSLLGVHSLRSGGATAAANNSVPDRLFKKHGRWLSDRSKDRYVHESLQQKLLVTTSLGL